MSMQLAHFDKAKQELLLAASMDEVKDIRNKAEALRMYMKQSSESLEMQNKCSEIKLRADRKIGLLTKELHETGKIDKGGRPKTGSSPEPVYTESKIGLSELGIKKTFSHYAQALADMPEEVFEKHIQEKIESKEELTSGAMYREARKLKNPKYSDISQPPKELEPPASGGERKVSAVRYVHKENGEVIYELRIGPNNAGRNISDLYEQIKGYQENREWQAEIEELTDKAKLLRAEADRLDKRAKEESKLLEGTIKEEIEFEHGPIEPFVETYNVHILDKELEGRLNILGKVDAGEIASLLIDNFKSEMIKIINYGLWGDGRFLNFKSSPLNNHGVQGWTRIGSMDQVK